MRWIVLILALSACAPPSGREQRCDGVPFVFNITQQDNELLCDRVLFYSERAKQALDENGVLKADEYDETFKDVRVDIYNSAWLVMGGRTIEGNYYDGVISLNFDCRAFIHEMLHHIDLKRFNISSSVHLNWDRNGYDSSIKELEELPFTKRIIKVNVSPTKEQGI